MKTASKIVGFVLTLVLAWWSLRELVERFLPPLGKRWWAIIILSFVVAALLILIGAIKSFHERVIGELAIDYKSRLDRVRRLSAIQGQASQLEMLFYNHEDETENRQAYKTWAGLLQTALYDCFGHFGVRKLTRSDVNTIEVPEQIHVWFHFQRERLDELITEQIQAQSIAHTAANQKR